MLQRLLLFVQKIPFIKKTLDTVLQDKDIAELLQWSSIAFIFKFLSLPLWLLTSLIISRWYGAEAMWLYWLVTTVLGILVSIGMLGLWAAMPRFLWEARAKKTHDEPALYRTSMRIIFLSWMVCSWLLYFCGTFIAEWIFQEPKLVFPLQIASIFIIPLMIQSLNTSFLLASKKVYHAELISKLIVPCAMMLIVFLSYWFWSTYYIPIWAYLFTWVIGMLVSLYILWKHKYVAIRGRLFDWKRMMKVSFPLFLSGMAGMIVVYSDVIMLWRLGTTKEVWILKVITAFSVLLLVVPGIIEAILWAKIAETYWWWDKSSLQYMLSLSVIGSSLVAICMSVVFFFWWKYILSLWWEEFIIGAMALNIYVCWQMINVVSGNNRLYLQTTGKEKQLLICIIVAWVFNIVCNYFLIPLYGLLGAGIASFISYIIRNTIACIYVYKSDNIKTFISFNTLCVWKK